MRDLLVKPAILLLLFGALLFPAAPSAEEPLQGKISTFASLAQKTGDEKYLWQALEQVEKGIQRDFAPAGGYATLETCLLGEIQKNIPAPKNAILVYSLGEISSHLFLITRDSAKVFDLPPAEKFEKRLTAFRKNLTNSDSWRNVLELLALELHDILLGPARIELKNIEHLTIIPSGALRLLPFEALRTLKSGKSVYMVEEFDISYSPSLSLLCPGGMKNAGGARPSPDFKELVGFGNPEGGRDSALELDAVSRIFYSENKEINLISGSGLEKKTLSNLLNLGAHKKTSALGAGEEEFKLLMAEGAKYVHISTICATGPGGRPALKLSPGGGEDGFLTASEILQMNIQSEMVMLSACNPGDEAAGTYGLPRAFLLAGAESVVMPLWEATTEEHRNMIVKLYRMLKTGDEMETALRKVKTEILEQGRHPFYWAPLIIIGTN